MKPESLTTCARQNQQQLRAAPGIGAVVLTVAVILIAANLRAPMTSVSPLLDEIIHKLGMSHPAAGAITTLPLMAFAAFSLLSSRLSGRYGMERVLLAALILLAGGLLLRPWRGSGLLLAGTALAGMGIAVCNVLLPALINRYFPQRLGVMTGMYTVSMNLIGSLASAMSVPIARTWGLGWEKTLALWGVVALITALYWLFYMRTWPSPVPQAAAGDRAAGRMSLWRFRLSWQMTLHLGLQSFFFYIVMAWLPHIAAERGIGAETAGWMVSLMQFGGLPFNFFVPLIAVRMKDQRALVMVSAVMTVAGIACLFTDRGALLALGGALVGSAAAAAFSLSMMFFNLRTADARQAAEMSGMAQSVGYLLACTGPVLFGWLHDLTGGWNAPLYVLTGFVLVFIWAGLGAGRNTRLPGSEKEERNNLRTENSNI